MNMSNTANRGWTWGVAGLTPIAALNTLGNFQIAGNFITLKLFQEKLHCHPSYRKIGQIARFFPSEILPDRL